MATLEFALRLCCNNEMEVTAFPPLFVDTTVPFNTGGISASSDAAEEAVAVSESKRQFDSDDGGHGSIQAPISNLMRQRLTQLSASLM